MPFGFGQGFCNIMRAPAADHLHDAAFAARAEDGAIGPGLAETVGAAAIAFIVLRKFAAGLFAGAFELIGGMLAQRDVSGKRGSADAKDANQDEKDTRVSHG
jgi:hypothetical protein